MMTNLIGELRNIGQSGEKGGFFGFFKKTSNKISTMRTKYDKASVNVDKICTVLEDHQIQLMKDVALLDEMYKLNLTYFKELSMYILAGKRKLEEVRTKELPPLVEKAQKTGLPEDAQAANDMAALCNRFEKKLHDLELTRDGVHPNGAADPADPEQRHCDDRENPVHPGEHHPRFGRARWFFPWGWCIPSRPWRRSGRSPI